MILATVAYLLVAQQPTAPAVDTLKIGTLSVPLIFTPEPGPKLPPEYLTWSGWKYFAGNPTPLPPIFKSGESWSPEDIAFYLANKANPSAAIWKARFFLLANCQVQEQFPNGVIRSRRFSLESPQISACMQSIARFCARVCVVTNGDVRVEPEVTILPDAVSDRAAKDRMAFAPEYLTQILNGRVNGGTFDADDRIYRGPYHSVVVIDALSRPPGSMTKFRINGMQAAEIPFFAGDNPTVAGEIDRDLGAVWTDQLRQRVVDLGWPNSDLAATTPFTPPTPWKPFLKLEEPTSDERLARIVGIPSGLTQRAIVSIPASNPSSPVSQNFRVTLVTDRDRGTVLNVSEIGIARTGGVALPWPAHTNIAQTPFLRFWAKSKSQDPLALAVTGENKTAWISLGPDQKVLLGDDASASVPLDFKPDGTWQLLNIPLKEVMAKAGISEIESLSLGVSPAANLAGRIQLETIAAQFSDFELTAEGPSSIETTEDPTEIILAELAHVTQTSPELVSNLKSPNRTVRLNAAIAFQRIKDPATEPILFEISSDLDGVVAEQAVMALGFQGTDTAKELLRKTLRFALSERVRGDSAVALANYGDPKLTAEMMVLLSARSPYARQSLIGALGKLSSPEAGIVRMALLQQEDPQIKLAVIASVDPSKEYEIGKLRWSAINESSDAVRAASALKLIQSPLPGLAAEGYQCVKDDSVWVRLNILNWMGENPKETHREALRQAIVDRSPKVRVAALKAFGHLEAPVKLEEIANILKDSHPDVQLALIELAEKQSLKLPTETMALLKASPDPRVIHALTP